MTGWQTEFQGFTLTANSSPLFLAHFLYILKSASRLLFTSPSRRGTDSKGDAMPNSAYKVIDVIGTSEVSWEEAAQRAIAVAGESLHNLRVAEVVKLDMKIEDGKVVAYRARLNLSFKIGR